MPDRAAVILVELLRDKDADVRWTASESLGKLGDGTVVQAVIPLLKDPEATVRAAAAVTLGRIGSAARDQAGPALVRALRDPEERVQKAAVLAIGDAGLSESMVREVLALLQREPVEIRRAAALALMQIEIKYQLEPLAEAVRDADTVVRQAAAAALGESGEASAVERLDALALNDADTTVRVEAVYRLSKTPGERSRKVLNRIAEGDRDADVRRWARAD